MPFHLAVLGAGLLGRSDSSKRESKASGWESEKANIRSGGGSGTSMVV